MVSHPRPSINHAYITYISQVVNSYGIVNTHDDWKVYESSCFSSPDGLMVKIRVMGMLIALYAYTSCNRENPSVLIALTSQLSSPWPGCSKHCHLIPLALRRAIPSARGIKKVVGLGFVKSYSTHKIYCHNMFLLKNVRSWQKMEVFLHIILSKI